MVSAPKRYPATEENSTLTESRNFVISVKFRMKAAGNDCIWVPDKPLIYFMQTISNYRIVCGCKDTAPSLFSQYISHNLNR